MGEQVKSKGFKAVCAWSAFKSVFPSDRPTILGRDLHEALEVKTPYTQWFDRMAEYGFTENADFILVSQKCETNNPKNPHTTITDHQLTIDMAKEICMIQRSLGIKERFSRLRFDFDYNILLLRSLTSLHFSRRSIVLFLEVRSRFK